MHAPQGREHVEGKLNTETPAYHHRVEGHIWSDLIAESK